MNQPSPYDNMIVEVDNVFDYALMRNVGFIEILYDGPTLVSMGVDTYNNKRLGQPLTHGYVNRYVGQAYPGAVEDLSTLNDLLDQIAERIAQNINTTYKRYGEGRSITHVVLHEGLLLVALG